MSIIARRKFFEEMSLFLNRSVTVVTRDNETFIGELAGYDPVSMSVCLRDARDKKGVALYRLLLHGSVITKIVLTEKPFDLRALADRIGGVFPNMVKLIEEAGVIVVMDKIRVTEKGVIEGEGPAAERVERIYEKFMEEIRAPKSE